MAEPTISDAEVVSVRVNGRIYEGWSSAQVTRSMTAAAASFSVFVPWFLPKPGEPLLARPGDALVIEIGGVQVLSGYVDEIAPSTDPERAGVQISGRSKTGDIVDCDAIVSGGQLRNLGLLAIARTLCKPFGISAALDSGVSEGKPFVLVEVEQSETVHRVITRLARERGLLVWPSSDGNLVIGRGARGRAAVALMHRIGANGDPAADNNVLTMSGRFSVAGRFSQLIVKGQSSWNFQDPALRSAQPKGVARDAGVARYRPKIVNAENAADSSVMAARAQWESARRIGAGTQVSASVDGWRQTPGGALWDIGLTARVVGDMLNLDRDMLVSGVVFRVDGNALRADLTLEPPEAHTPQPVQPANAGGGLWASVRNQTRG